MNMQKILFILILSTSLWGCFHEEDDTKSGFNADINGQWTLTSTITSSPCYPDEVGYSYTETIVISETAGDIYVDGVLEPDTSYSDGVIRVNYTESYFGVNYQSSMTLTFSDENNASGTSTETATYEGETCTVTETITLTRIGTAGPDPDPIVDPTGGFNADINGQWSLTATITSSPCDPDWVDSSYTETIVVSETAGNIYVDGILAPDTSYSDGVIRVNYTESGTDYSYQSSMALAFTDNNHASGTSTETETYMGMTCTVTESITLSRQT